MADLRPFWICTLTFSLTLGFGDREFGEPCEPIRTQELVPRYDGYGNQQQGSYGRDQNRAYGDERDRNYGVSRDGVYQPTGNAYPRGQQPYYPRRQNEIPSDADTRFAHLAREVNETRRCRSERGLRCDPYTRSCKCFELAGASWSHERERCEFTLIGTFCSPKITEFAQYCTEYAQCTCNWEHWDRRRWFPCDNPPVMDFHPFPGAHVHDTNNGRCLCEPGYRAHKDNSGCWYSSANDLCPERLFTIGLIVLTAFSKYIMTNY